MIKVNPGVTSDNVILNAEEMYVFSTGIANNTTVNEDSFVFVSKGGIVNDTVINDWGEVDVESSGTANNTVVNAGGHIIVYSKAKAIGTVVKGGMTVYSGGIASDTTVTGGMYVSEGGRLQGSTTVNQGGTATFEGGVYTGIEVHGGKLNLKISTESEDPDFCFFDKITVDSGGSMIVSAGGSASSATVSNASVTVRKDGILDYATLTDATIAVNDGAVVSRIDLKEGAVMNVTSGGTLQNIYVSAGAILTGVLREASQLKFYDGTLDLDISTAAPGNEFLIDDASFSVFEGSYSCTLTVSASQADGAYNLIEAAGGFDKTITVKDTNGTTLGSISVGEKTIGEKKYTLALDSSNNLTLTIAPPGPTIDLTGDLASSYDLETGKYASDVIILEGGKLNVYKDALASQTAVNSGGSLLIYDGGIASDTTINDKGKGYVFVGGIASKTEITSGGTMYVSGTADSATIAAGGFLWADPGAKLNNFDVSSGGTLSISSGATATGIVASEGAILGFRVAPDTYVQGTYAGSAFEMKDAALTGFTIRKDAYIDVYADGVTTDITVGEDGLLKIWNGGTAVNTTVGKGGLLTLREAGAVANGLAVQTGGKLSLYEAGGKLTGKVTFETGAGVYYSDGASATLDFDLTQTTVGADALVNDLSFVLAAPFNYTLTVAGTEAAGDYNLAGNAKGFDATITVKDTLGADLGTFALGEIEKVIGGTKYTLLLDASDNLSVTIGDYTPAVDLTGDLDYTYDLYAGNYASSVNILDGGELDVSGGLASQTTVQSGGELYINDGGVASDVTVNDGARAEVLSGGYASGIVAEAGAKLGFVAAPNTYAQGTYAGTAFEITDTVTGYTVHSGGWLDATNGGKADNTTVESGGYLYVYAGGSATGIVAEEGAYLSLEAGPGNKAQGTYAGSAFDFTDAVADYTVHSGYLALSAGARADRTIVDSRGTFLISGGGSADVTTVNPHAGLYVENGGKATKVTENGGFVSVSDGADVTFVANEFTGLDVNQYNSASVHSGTTATGTTLSDFGGLVVYDGGLAKNTTVNTNGLFLVNQGGLAENTTVNAIAGGGISIYGTANGVTIANGGAINVNAGGKVTGKITFETGADITAEAGAILNFDLTQTAPGADALVNDLSFALAQPFSYTLTVDGTEAAGDYKLAENATGFDKTITVVNTSGVTLDTITIAEGTKTIGGRDYTLTLTPGGLLGVTLAGGADIIDLTGDLTSAFELTAGKVGSSVNILDGGELDVSYGGFTEITTVNSGGDLNVAAGGSANIVTVNFGGGLNVLPNGSATLVTENGGFVNVSENAVVTFVSHSFDGYTYEGSNWGTVHSGTTATDITVGLGAEFKVFSGGTATLTENGGKVFLEDGANVTFVPNTIAGIEVKDGAQATLHSGTVATDTTVSDGTILVYSGGIVQNTTVNNGGSVVVSSGGKVTGKMTFETGAAVTAETGAILDFDLTQTTAGADALVNDISFALAQPFSYTLTVDGTQSTGTYKLAGNATGFSKIITVKSTLGEEYGYLTFGGTLSTSFANYTLALADDNTLTVNVVEKGGSDTTPPVVSNIKADITTPTNGNVTVTAEFTDNVAVASRLFNIDDGEWQDYNPATGVVMTTNGTVNFKAIDTAGNESEGVNYYTVSNIDKVDPTIMNIMPSTSEYGVASVTVTAEFYDDIELASKQFRLGDGAWQDYDPAVGAFVTENTTVTFKAVDVAGNTATDSYEVTNIAGGGETVNGPAEPKNNTLYLDKWTVNTDVTEAYGTHLTAPEQEARLDLIGTVDVEGYHNSIDMYDTIDYAKIVLEHGAKLSFHAESTAAATFTVYNLTQSAKTGKYTLKKLQTLKLKDKDGDGVYTADSSKLVSLSVSGDYYVSMQFTDKDKSKTAYYNVTLNGAGSKTPSEFYPLGDNSDDWGDMKTAGYAGAVGDLGKIEASGDLISGEWAGFGDKVDYKKFTLASAAELSLSVSAQDGPLKLTLCKLKETVKKSGTTYSQVSIKTITVKAGQTKSLDNLRLAAGEYFFKVESTNVKKSTGYSVQITSGDFYVDGDNGWNNVLLEKKALNENVQYFYDNALSVSGAIHLDKAGDYKTSGVAAEYMYEGEKYGGFVCFGDETDFAKLTLTQTSKVAFTLSATNDATLEIIKVTQNGEKYTKKSLQTVKYKAGNGPATSKKTVSLEVKDGVSYYVSVKATNVKNTKVDPKTYYNVSYSVESSEASALAMPETSEALAMTDSLSFGSYDTDALASASASSLTDLNDKSGWLNIASLA